METGCTSHTWGLLTEFLNSLEAEDIVASITRGARRDTICRIKPRVAGDHLASICGFGVHGSVLVPLRASQRILRHPSRWPQFRGALLLSPHLQGDVPNRASVSVRALGVSQELSEGRRRLQAVHLSAQPPVFPMWTLDTAP